MMLSHANVSRAMACFEHSNFFKVTAPSFIIQWTEQKEGPLAYKLQLQEDETATDHFSDLSGE